MIKAMAGGKAWCFVITDKTARQLNMYKYKIVMLQKITFLILIPFLLQGCMRFHLGVINTPPCDLINRGGKETKFTNLRFAKPESQAMVIIYRPYWEKAKCLDDTGAKFQINKTELLKWLRINTFSALYLDKKDKNEITSFQSIILFWQTKDKVILENIPGKVYYLRWSSNPKLAYKDGNPKEGEKADHLQLVDEATALKELSTTFYIPPLDRAVPVFDKKTGKAL